MTAPACVRVTGPLVPYVSGFRAELTALGYTPLSARDQLRLSAHLSRWLAGRGHDVRELTPVRVEQFLRSTRRAGYKNRRTVRGLMPLLDYLRRLVVVPQPTPPISITPFLYSETDIAALMAAARTLRSPLRAATFEALVGLLTVTGLRVGEAIRLDRNDIDWENALLTVRMSKFNKITRGSRSCQHH